MSKVRLAIIGNGMVGHRFIEDLLDKSDAANFDITVFCEEPRIAYDRVHLSSYFSHHTAEELSLVREGFYEKHGIKVLVGERAITINRQEKVIHSSAGRTVFYDKLIMATGSYPWIPPIKGSDTQDCFVYRTIEDLNAIESCARRSKRGAVVGGGLLGLEAAGALKNLGIETHVIEFAPMLMAEQLDQMGGEQLRRKIESMGVRVHTSKNTLEIVQEGVEARKTMRFADGSELEVDFIVFSTGIRPRDKLATQCGLDVAPRGGIVINDSCQTSDPDIYAIGECASWNNRVFGLVAPGYKMAQVAVDHILGSENAFEGADLSAKLKLLGVDVGGIGDAHGRTPGARSYVYLDESKEIYKRLIVSEDNKTLLGAVLVGDTSDYGNLLQLVLNAIELPENPDSLILPAHSGSGKPSIGVDKLPDSAQICSCFDVTKGDLIAAINKGCHTVAALKAETKAGTGCGGCIPLVTQVLNAELAKQGIEVNNNLCEHFAYSRQELFHLIRVEGIKTFEELLAKHGKGYGCEVCKPTVGSLLASCWNEYILKPEHTPLQDSNDNFLANIQKDGTYSVIPRSPGGEITPEGLMAVGRIAREFNLYTKITGSQRLAMFGAQKVAGDGLRSFLASMTSNSFRRLITGVGVTAAIQSSTATTIMDVSFVNAGLLTLAQAIGVIMGANIGTTVTSWIMAIFGFSYDISTISFPLIALGFIMMMNKSNKKIKELGEIIIGFALFFVGFAKLKETSSLLLDNMNLDGLQALTNLYLGPVNLSVLIFLLIGTVLTICFQSSAATMAIIMLLITTGVIPFKLAAAMILGENIGTTIATSCTALCFRC